MRSDTLFAIAMWSFIGTCASITTTSAQQYPSKPIRLVVGFAAGGPSDAAARTIAQKLNEKWGQQVIVDIHPGAGGNIATEIVAKRTADGGAVPVASAIGATRERTNAPL